MTCELPNLQLFGGPLDGAVVNWSWYDNDAGRAGRAAGLLVLGDLHYRVTSPHVARYERGRARGSLLEQLKAQSIPW